MAITNELITEINKLAKKQKNEGLTEQEKKKQAELRNIYRQEFRGKVKSQLNNVVVVEKYEIKVDLTQKMIQLLNDISGIEKIENREILYDPKKISEKELIRKVNFIINQERIQ